MRDMTESASIPPPVAGFLAQGVLLDLEVSHGGKLLKVGAARGEQTFLRSGRFDKDKALAELDGFAEGAGFILGHNVLRHDLALLREKAPDLVLHRLPVVDTLFLSPIAFPENPYHRLVKDYKLVTESVNDPVADARLAATLFADEAASLAGLRQTEPRLFESLHGLLSAPSERHDPLARGMRMVFELLGAPATGPDMLPLCRVLLARWGCAQAAASLAGADLAGKASRLDMAYTLSWLRVAGSNSVVPPWVRLEFPGVTGLVRRFRDRPCQSPDCEYCGRVHDPRRQLTTFFGFENFRALPANPEGGSLQRDIVEAGFRDESLLAILPTGGGKSLCYQLPGLVRNYRRGSLTIVVSPLQALMKDQVDGLARATGTPFAAALYGLLTLPERGDVLQRVRMGDVALLHVSPEQLRNRSFRSAVAQREIGCWVFDEAHCLSKWGHDFRPDYLYAGRFVRELAERQNVPVPPVACFTATAKLDVREEIQTYFRRELGCELALFESGVERENLRFLVQTIGSHTKMERVHDLLSDRLPGGAPGCALVFRATRAAARETAEFLQAKGWQAASFHAGLMPSEKKRIQDEFLGGELRVVCATNAFGMGIDKPDVRLVVHADIPGSLENYMQEAGRGGRDNEMAECILLYDEEDCERQFGLGAFSELSRKDIAQILRGLRKAARGKDEVVITSGELLRDEDLQLEIDAADATADTKVRTGVAWLERAGFVQREENVTSVFQARLLVRDMHEAEEKIDGLQLSENERGLWRAILSAFMNAGATDSLTVDHLALLPEWVGYAHPAEPNVVREERAPWAETASPERVSARILRVLRAMVEARLMKRDTLLTAYVRYKVADHSGRRLERILRVDRRLVGLLAETEPDPEGWMPLHLRMLNQRLLDEGEPTSPDLLRKLLKSLSEDGRGFAGSHGSLELRHRSRDTFAIRVRRSWAEMEELAERRRQVAVCILSALLDRIPQGTPPQADFLVEFTLEALHEAVASDLTLRAQCKDIESAVERALMYLHEQEVVVLQQGLAVFRSAMTIRVLPEAKGRRYTREQYRPLDHHYRERVFQIHVMSEFARRGLERIREALALVVAYFTMDKEQFIQRYFEGQQPLLQHATTGRSYQRIVEDLGNREQTRMVTAPADSNMLILAGPGSGKTKTIIHRCAYLLRVLRVPPRAILVCCFNRRAAVELRKRLADLVGADARGVTVQTYHGLALRLLGRSLATPGGGRNGAPDFDSMIRDAVSLLRGQGDASGLPADELRDRVLAGYDHILVDEYQDIDEPQYELISAIAGRTLADPDQKLSLLAVGDDDQNIYTFRGANVAFIHRFQQDYEADVHYLVENYRSTPAIIGAANAFIAANGDRMKTGHPIRPARRRGDTDGRPPDPVEVVSVNGEIEQAAAVLEEVERLRRDRGVRYVAIAILSRTHRDLARVRMLADARGIPVRWFPQRDKLPPLHGVREVRAVLGRLAAYRGALARAEDLENETRDLWMQVDGNPWKEFVGEVFNAWRCESENAEVTVQEALDFFHEYCAESRREFSYGDGLVLSTVHSAKGAEYDHVILTGAWPMKSAPKEREEERRVFYVGMTRARKTLTVFEQSDVSPVLSARLRSPHVVRREAVRGALPPAQPLLGYALLGLEEINLGYAGRLGEGHRIHRALASLKPGDTLGYRAVGKGYALVDAAGEEVARLSRKGVEAWGHRTSLIQEIRILAMVRRRADQEQHQPEQCRVKEWELPLCEVVYREQALSGPVE